jgi:hypothetical protein
MPNLTLFEQPRWGIPVKPWRVPRASAPQEPRQRCRSPRWAKASMACHCKMRPRLRRTAVLVLGALSSAARLRAVAVGPPHGLRRPRPTAKEPMTGARAILETSSENRARHGLLVEWLDRAMHALERDLAVVAGERRVGASVDGAPEGVDSLKSAAASAGQRFGNWFLNITALMIAQ